MTRDRDDESADEKFENFQKVLKEVLTAPKPSGNGENSSEPEEQPSG